MENDDETFIAVGLTKEETKALMILFGYIGGSPLTSLRRATDSIRESIYCALRDPNRPYDSEPVYKILGIEYDSEGTTNNYVNERYNLFHFKDGAL